MTYLCQISTLLSKHVSDIASHKVKSQCVVQYTTRNHRSCRDNLYQYKVMIQEALRSGALGEKAALLDVIKVQYVTGKNEMEVKCRLPILSEYTGADEYAVALKAETLINSNDCSLRSHIYKMNSTSRLKIPTFRIYIASNSGTTSFPDDSQKTNSSTHNFDDLKKPTSVYGLGRNKILQNLKTVISKNAKLQYNSKQPQTYINANSMSTGKQYGQILASNNEAGVKWAKFWKQRQDKRYQVKRERKQSAQNAAFDYMSSTCEKL